MASSQYSVSQVCQILAGEDGELEYMFPGSDDDLDMEEQEMSDIDIEEEEMADEAVAACMDGEGENEREVETESEGDRNDDSDESTEGDDVGTRARGGRRGSRQLSCYGVARKERSRSRRRTHGSSITRGQVSGRGRGHGRRTGPEPEREWTEIASPVTVQAFTKSVGPTFPVSSDATEVFLTLFTPELLELLVQQTNDFAALCLAASHSGEGAPPTWTTTVEEMKAFIGFSVLMGIVKLPDLYDYWSSSEVLHSFPVAARIPRKRYLELRRYLHFVDNASLPARGEEGYDRLGKVRPVIEAVRESFLSRYSPHCQSSIDEAMVKFKGQSSLKQYLPKKTTKRGFKIWVRADSINGYVSDFEVYTGRGDTTTTSLGARVVEKLSSPLVGGHYHLFFDNFFSSLPLLDSLLSNGLYACATFRRDRRGVPRDLSSIKLGWCVCMLERE